MSSPLPATCAQPDDIVTSSVGTLYLFHSIECLSFPLGSRLLQNATLREELEKKTAEFQKLDHEANVVTISHNGLAATVLYVLLSRFDTASRLRLATKDISDANAYSSKLAAECAELRARIATLEQIQRATAEKAMGYELLYKTRMGRRFPSRFSFAIQHCLRLVVGTYGFSARPSHQSQQSYTLST